MSEKISSYQAKKKLLALLKGVQSGENYTITHKGKPVAELVPSKNSKESQRSTAVKNLLAFAAERKPADELHINSLIEDGRL